jgi:hypothetical protein
MKFNQLPAPFPGQQMWGTRLDRASYMIVKDDGLFTASVRPIGGKTQYLIPYAAAVMTMDEAREACLKHAKGIHQ